MWRDSRTPFCQGRGKKREKARRSAFTQLVAAGTAVIAVTYICGIAFSSGTPPTTNVQVNQVFDGPFVPNRQNEPSLAQNPTDSLNLIAGAQIVFSRSTDEGETWTNPRPVSPAFLQFSVEGVPAREAPTCKWPFPTTEERLSQVTTLPWLPLRIV